eukprot:364426-Chlamydomonas_euryale.AAC.39
MQLAATSQWQPSRQAHHSQDFGYFGIEGAYSCCSCVSCAAAKDACCHTQSMQRPHEQLDSSPVHTLGSWACCT